MAQYADIDNVILSPEEPQTGDQVTLYVDVRNIYSSVFSAKLIGTASYYVPGIGILTWVFSFEPSTVNINPGLACRFMDVFTMPYCTRMTAYFTSFWYGSDGQWHPDDAVEYPIKEEEIPDEEFSDFTISAVSKV